MFNQLIIFYQSFGISFNYLLLMEYTALKYLDFNLFINIQTYDLDNKEAKEEVDQEDYEEQNEDVNNKNNYD